MRTKLINFGCYLLLFAFGFAVSGCFPYRYTKAPGVSGIVLDGNTERPLPHARVSLDTTNVVTVAISAADGSFAVPPKRQWGIWIVSQDVFTFPWPVYISHDSYETKRIAIPFNMGMTGKRATENLGKIHLMPLRQNATP